MLEPMVHSSKFNYVAAGAVMLPGLVLAVETVRSGETFREFNWLLALNWGLLILPQLFVIVLAIIFPKTQSGFATRALIVLSALFLIFAYITSLDPNGPMLWIFYFGLSVVLLPALALFPSPRANTRRL